MENGGPTNHHRLIVPDPRQATHVAIERTRDVALPSVDTDDRHTAEVDHVNDAVLQRYGVRATVRCSLFHGDPRDGVVERVHVLELHGGAALEWRPARALLSELVGDDRRALELWLATNGVIDGREWTAPGWYVGAAVGSNGVFAPLAWACPFEFVSCGRGRRLACWRCAAKQRRRISRRCRTAVGWSLPSRDGCPRRSRTSRRG